MSGMIRILVCVLAATASPLARAQSDRELPPVLRVRVPEDTVRRYFPPGTPLRVLPSVEFERLMARANAASNSSRDTTGVRLLQATHQARWMDDGSLEGRSTLTIDAGPTAPAAVALEPWSAPVQNERTPSNLRTRPDGTLVAWIERPGISNLLVPWRIEPRSGSEPGTFVIGLPRVALSSLLIDLPATHRLVLSNAQSARMVHALDEGRNLWRADHVSGTVTLRMRTESSDAHSRVPPIWQRASSRYRVQAGSVEYAAEWLLAFAADRPLVLEATCDPTLIPSAVEGEEVEGFATEPHDDGSTRLRIQLADTGTDQTTIRLRGRARIPSEGTWSPPRVRLEGAHWQGGRTLVAFADGRQVESCGARASTRVAPTPSERATMGGAAALFAFEEHSDAPVANFSLRVPNLDATVSLRGRFALDVDQARLDATVAWNGREGRPASLQIALPAEWVCEQVRILGLDEPTAWTVERVGDSSDRIKITPPVSVDFSAPVVVALRARRSLLGGSEIAIPRLIASPGRIVNSSWGLDVNERLAITPTDPGSVDWIDPQQWVAESTPAGVLAPASAPKLCWRWLNGPQSVAFRLQAAESRPRADLTLLVRNQGDESWVDAFLRVLADDARLTHIQTLQPAGSEPWSWALWENGVDRPLEVHAVAQHEPRAGGARLDAYDLALPAKRARGDRLVFHASRRFDGPQFRLPLITVDGPWRFQGTILTATGTTRTLRVDGSALWQLNPSIEGLDAERGLPDLDDLQGPELGELSWSTAHRFNAGTPGHADVQARDLARVDEGGLILEAVLTTIAADRLQVRQSLQLSAVAEPGRMLPIRMPAGATLALVQVDGMPVVTYGSKDALQIPFAESIRPQTPRQVSLQYTAAIQPNLSWPEFGWPCLARRWTMAEESRFGSSLHAGAPARGWMSTDIAAQALDEPLWRQNRWIRPVGPHGGQTKTRLESALASALANRLTIEGLLERLSADSVPCVVDADALSDAGFGPATPLRPGSSGRSPGDQLREAGLDFIMAVAACVLTTRSEAETWNRNSARAAVGRDALGEAARAALADRQDATGRYVPARAWARRARTPRISLSESAPARRFVQIEHANRPQGADLTPRATGGPRAFLIAALIALIGTPWARFAPRSRAALVVASLVLSAVFSLRAKPPDSAWIQGIQLGGALLLVLWFAQRCAARVRARRPASRRLLLKPLSAINALLALTFSIGLSQTLGSRATSQEPDPGSTLAPILVLFPYENAAQSALPPTKAVLRLDAFERITAFLRDRAADQDADNRARLDGFGAREARHTLTRIANTIQCESVYTLVGASANGAEWSFPLSNQVGLTARLDGVPAAVELRESGRVGVVQIRGTGDHTLVLSRVVNLADADLGLPVNAVAHAQVERRELVSDPSGDRVVRVGVESIGLSSLIALKPDPLPVRFGDQVAFQALWHPVPAGDHVEARLIQRGRESLHALALRLEPGWQIRIPAERNRRDYIRHESPFDPSNPLIQFDPPLLPGESIRLEFWRPARLDSENRATPRSLPRWQCANAEVSAFTVAMRLDEGWSSLINDPLAQTPRRLDPLEAVGDWGRPPAVETEPIAAWDLLTSGELAIHLRAPENSVRLQPTVDYLVDGSQVALTCEAQVLDAPPWLDALEISLPPDFLVREVSADDRHVWFRTLANRLIVRWDGASTPPRRIRLTGWINTGRAAEPQGGSRELLLHIPRWHARRTEETIVRLAASPEIALDLEGAAGWTRSTSIAESRTSSPVRAAFAVAAGAEPARLRYRLDTRPTDVRVLSSLTILPTQVEWSAQARYSVRGGPCREMRLELPVSFAQNLDVRIQNARGRIHRIDQGTSTRIEIELEEPSWLEPTVVVNARIPLGTGPIEFPTLVPLGYGQVDTYLAWSDESGRGFRTLDSRDVEPVDPARFQPRSLSLADRPLRRVYHVLKGGWSLRLQPGRPASTTAVESMARVDHVEVEAQIARDDSFRGQTTCELIGSEGVGVRMLVPEGIEIEAATAAGNTLPCVRDGPRSVLIRWRGAAPRRLAVHWKGRLRESPSTSLVRFALPVPDQINVPIQFVLRCVDPAANITETSESITSTTLPSLLAERVENEARSLEIEVLTFDRGSPVERENLRSQLIDFESLALEAIEASDHADPRVVQSYDGVESLHARRVREARDLVRDALLAAGLHDLLFEAAEVRVISTQPATINGRFLGVPRYFRGSTQEAPPQFIARLTRPALDWLERAARPECWLSLLLAAALSLSVSRRSALWPMLGLGLAGILFFMLAPGAVLSIVPL